MYKLHSFYIENIYDILDCCIVGNELLLVCCKINEIKLKYDRNCLSFEKLYSNTFYTQEYEINLFKSLTILKYNLLTNNFIEINTNYVFLESINYDILKEYIILNIEIVLLNNYDLFIYSNHCLIVYNIITYKENKYYLDIDVLLILNNEVYYLQNNKTYYSLINFNTNNIITDIYIPDKNIKIDILYYDNVIIIMCIKYNEIYYYKINIDDLSKVKINVNFKIDYYEIINNYQLLINNLFIYDFKLNTVINKKYNIDYYQYKSINEYDILLCDDFKNFNKQYLKNKIYIIKND